MNKILDELKQRLGNAFYDSNVPWHINLIIETMCQIVDERLAKVDSKADNNFNIVMNRINRGG
jgi:hypothetical protein